MLFSKNTPAKKFLAISLFLLISLTAVPLFTVQASVDLLYFRTVAGSSSIKLEWETAQEFDNLGFNLYRGLSDNFNAATRLNTTLIQGHTGEPTGYYYEWLDSNVVIGTQYFYWLEDIDINSVRTTHGPETATATGGSNFPTVPPPGNSTATPTPTRTPTRTPTPTTQSGSAATQTPPGTPTATSAASNPTATTQTQVQPTPLPNNTSGTVSTQTQTNNNNATNVPTENEQQAAPTETAQPTTETTAPLTGATPDSLAQSLSEADPQESESTALSASQIGQGGQDTQEARAGTNNDGSSNRSTAVLMALIVSVIFLVIGGGGIVVLLLNRSKQLRT